MQLKKKNIKLSIKASSSKCLPEILERVNSSFTSSRLTSKIFGNFIQLSEVGSSLRISFFKKRCHQAVSCDVQNDENYPSSHINITGIEDEQDYQRAIIIIKDILECTDSDLVIHVDSITFSGQLSDAIPKPINLTTLCNSINLKTNLSARYNRESFTGLCIYGIKACVILYSSGSLLVIARELEENGLNLAQIVQEFALKEDLNQA